MAKTNFCIVVILSFLTACSTRPAKPLSTQALNDLGEVAVVPFENYSSNANAGLILSDQLANEIMVSTNLKIMKPEKVRLILAPHAGEILSASKMAKMLKVKTIITGTVTEYRYKTGISQQPVLGMTIYVIDTKTGNVLWSANTARGSLAFFDSSSLGVLAQERCADIVKNLIMVEKKVAPKRRR